MNREQILQMAREAGFVEYELDDGTTNAFDIRYERFAKLIAEHEQAQQAEPVVWMYQNKSTHEVRFQKHMRSFVDHSAWYEVPLYSEPLANHELQCVCGAVWCGDEMVHLPNKTPPRQPEQPKVRTGDCLLVGICASEGHKIQPPRQPLTDEQIGVIATQSQDGISPLDDTLRFARAIEAAYGIKEKNNG
jgi:hypothetical protein